MKTFLLLFALATAAIGQNVDVPAAANPSPPPAGYLRLIYRDGGIKTVDPNGVIASISSGGGGGDLTSGPVTSSSGVSAIADGALSIAKTNTLSTVLGQKVDNLEGYAESLTLDGPVVTGSLVFASGISSISYEISGIATLHRAALFPATGVATALGNAVNASGGVITFGNQTDTLIVAMSDETTAITTGTKMTIRAPYAMTITGIKASLTTASSSTEPIIDVHETGTTIMATTKLRFDITEKTTTTYAGTAAAVSDTAIAADAELTFDVDTAGTGAAGLKVYITHTH